MKFPLKKRKIWGYRFWVKTFYSPHHLGVDYEANHDLLYAPTNGKIVALVKNELTGGNWIYFQDNKGKFWRFAHLSQFKVKQGQQVKKGDLIGRTGNTGKYTTGPHLHLDLWHKWPNVVALRAEGWPKNWLINPEKYINNTKKMATIKQLKKKVEKIKGLRDKWRTLAQRQQKELKLRKKSIRILTEENEALRKTLRASAREIKTGLLAKIKQFLGL